jgi:putative transcriptional regulator
LQYVKFNEDKILDPMKVTRILQSETPLGAFPSAEAVKAFRAAQNLTQSDCAALVHVTPRAWQMYEAGDRRMPAGLWELINIKAPPLRV